MIVKIMGVLERPLVMFVAVEEVAIWIKENDNFVWGIWWSD